MAFSPKNSYSKEELLDCADGNLFGADNGKLPTPNMLMFDRITKISDSEGKYKKGKIIAELDVNPDLWFFDCHFKGDPVMPGCLGLDAMWQLVGFYLIDMKRILNLDLTVGIGEGTMLVDDREIYTAKGLKVGLFQDTSSF